MKHRKSNSMQSRRSIDVIHYALDDWGNPLKIFDNHPVLPGYQFIILICYKNLNWKEIII